MKGNNGSGWVWGALGAGAALAALAVTRRGRVYDLRGRVVLDHGGLAGAGAGAGARVCGRGGAGGHLRARRRELARARGGPEPPRGRACWPCPATSPTGRRSRRWSRRGARSLRPDRRADQQRRRHQRRPGRDHDAARTTRRRWRRTSGGRCTRSWPCCPRCARGAQGRIVNIASIGGKVSVPHLLPYSASKFALVGLSEGLRAELAQGRHRGDDGLPGPDAHRQPAQRDLQGPAPGRVRLVQHQRLAAAADHRWRRAGGPADRRRLPARRRRGGAVAAGQAGGAVPRPVPGADRRPARRWSTGCCPAPGGIGTARVKGKESESALSPSWLTTLSDQAAARNNEM